MRRDLLRGSTGMPLRPLHQTIVVLAVALVCACTGIVWDGQVSNPITIDELRNAVYPSRYTLSGIASLRNGECRERDGASGEIVVTMTERVTYGISGGRPVAAVVLRTTAGGTGAFYDLALLTGEPGGVRVLGLTSLGDRVTVEALAIGPDGVDVSMVAHKPDDPMCCPSAHVRRHYRLGGDALVQTDTLRSSTLASLLHFRDRNKETI
jgi:hypothetical protein